MNEALMSGTGTVELVIRPEDGYFILDSIAGTVTCPAGKTLNKKCNKSNGYTRYMSKAACSHCLYLSRCYRGSGRWKEIDFPDGALFVKCRNWSKE